jgi:hypothetical protein
MIWIDKSGHPTPKILAAKGAAETARMKNAYDAGARTFVIQRSIYGGDTVKKALVDIQHKKCVFCEAKITGISHGDVEHYRPKGGFVQADGDTLTQPGYYWLAYDWSNLSFCCQICNQVYKKNYFPLANPAGRALSHHHPLAAEDALIINPAGDRATENPEDHITFRKEVVKGLTPKGLETIKRTGIDRADLEEMRFEYFQILERLAKVARGSTPDAVDAKNHFKTLGQPDKQFSAMVKANFPDLV